MPTDQVKTLDLDARELYYQRFNHHPLFTIVGAGYEETREGAIRLLVRYVTDPVTPGVLAAEGVRYVVLHDDVYRSEGLAPPILSHQTFVPLARFGDIRVFRLDAAPADVGAALAANQASLALVEGLPAPTISYGEGFSPRGDSQVLPRTSAARSELSLERTGGAALFQFIVEVAASKPGSLTLSVNGQTIGDISLQPSGGSLPRNAIELPSGHSAVHLDATEPFALTRLQIQPLADITTRLNQ
jgi:hypothetical protein